MDITVDEIKSEIKEYEGRIQLAKSNLANLPVGSLPYKENKKRSKQCRDLQADITHFNVLIGYANEGIELREAEAS